MVLYIVLYPHGPNLIHKQDSALSARYDSNLAGINYDNFK